MARVKLLCIYGNCFFRTFWWAFALYAFYFTAIKNILSMWWFIFLVFAAMSVFHCTPVCRDGSNPSSWNSEVRSLIFPRTYSPCLLSQFEELSEQSQTLLSPQSSHQNILTNMASFLRSSRTILYLSNVRFSKKEDDGRGLSRSWKGGKLSGKPVTCWPVFWLNHIYKPGTIHNRSNYNRHNYRLGKTKEFSSSFDTFWVPLFQGELQKQRPKCKNMEIEAE